MIDLYVVLNQLENSLKHSKTLGPEEKDQTALVKENTRERQSLRPPTRQP